MASTSDQITLLARVEDTIRLCDKRQTPCFFGFLDQQEQAIVSRHLSHEPNWLLWGGYADAERRLFVSYPEYVRTEDIDHPLVPIAFAYRKEKALSHRDFLGTLLSAGLRREAIGDILCGSGLTVLFLKEELVHFVCEQVTKIGGEGVRITPYYTGDLPLDRQFKEITDTVASPRLDAIVKSLIRCSREDAAQRVRLGSVSVDHIVTEDVAAHLTAPCVVSVKSCGRYYVDQIGPETKKGRLTLKARKCI